MDIANPIQITAFLLRFKEVAQKDFRFIPRGKNLQFITSLGIMPAQAKNMILELTYENYCKGPKEDKNVSGQYVWEFGIALDGEGIYIKLSEDFRGGVAKCISFHKPEFKLTYPHRR